MEKIEEVEFGEDFANAAPIWNAEVKFMLENRINEEKSDVNTTMKRQILDHVRKFSQYSNKEALLQAKDHMARMLQEEKYQGISQFDMALLNNLRIDEPAEAKSLIPSLQKISDQDVQVLLGYLQTYQNAST